MTDTNGVHVQSPKDINHFVGEIDRLSTEYFVNKAPFAIPEGWKETIITIMAVFNVIGLIILVPALLVLIGLGAVVAPFAAVGGNANLSLNGIGIVTTLFTIVSFVLMILAAPGLFKREKKAWTYSFYNVLVGVVSNIVTFNVGGLIIGTIINLYVLFQLKSNFKN